MRRLLGGIAGAGLLALALGAPHTTQARADDLTSPTLAAVGDMACDSSASAFNGGLGTASDCAAGRVSTAMLNDSTIDGGVLGLGDYQYDCGDPADYAVSYDPTWGRLDPQLDATVAGNHEYKTGNDVYGAACPSGNATAEGYFARFGFTSVTSYGPVSHPDTQGHFSFDLGSWHIIGLNGNCTSSQVGGCTASGTQSTWLRADLAATAQPCILAFWHQPRWTGVGTGKNASYKAWWAALYASHADVVINGHIHNYQRFPPLNGAGVPDPSGVTEYVVGTGGERQVPVKAGVSPAPAAHSQAFGYLRMTLLPSGWTEDFVDWTGTVLDTSTGQCH